jgi:hypothetical protein
VVRGKEKVEIEGGAGNENEDDWILKLTFLYFFFFFERINIKMWIIWIESIANQNFRCG